MCCLTGARDGAGLARRPASCGGCHRGARPYMAMRNRSQQPLALRRSAARARHLGRGAGLVEVDERGRVEIKLLLEAYWRSRACIAFSVMSRAPSTKPSR